MGTVFLLTRHAKCSERLRTGAYFITFTRPLPSLCFDVLENEIFNMSWGSATVYIAVRNEWPSGSETLITATEAQQRVADAYVGGGGNLSDLISASKMSMPGDKLDGSVRK